MDTVSIFCAIDDFCELFEPHWQPHLLAAASKQRDRKPRLCLSEVLTIIVGVHLSGYRTFKGYYTQHVLPHQLLLSQAGQLSALCGIDARCATPAVGAADDTLWAMQRN